MKDLPTLVIGLHGTRGVGKDTLAAALHSFDRRFYTYSFARALKDDLFRLITDRFALNVHTVTGADKELIRPILISYGMAQRARDPDHWCKRVSNDILHDWRGGFVDYSERGGIGPEGDYRPHTITPVVTDVRFVNEVNHLRATFPRDSHHAGAVIVNVTRDGAPPPTEEEEKHYRDVAALADIHFHWGNDSWGEQCEKARKLREDVMHLFDYA